MAETSTKLPSSNLKEQGHVLNGGGVAGDECCQESGFEKRVQEGCREIGYAKNIEMANSSSVSQLMSPVLETTARKGQVG